MKKSVFLKGLLGLMLLLGVTVPFTTSCSSKTVIIKPKKGKAKGHKKAKAKGKAKGHKKVIIIK